MQFREINPSPRVLRAMSALLNPIDEPLIWLPLTALIPPFAEMTFPTSDVWSKQ
ncbi:hypothetical protein [Mannheimia indoligenes]|uniref:hypothetical protein n=1 Tax=Mannheimia indoligenes TaxID=3103145 RepID=UPI002FE64228